MEMISRQRQELIEELHMFEGFFDELLLFNTILSGNDIGEQSFPIMFEMFRDRYKAFSDKMTAELFEGKGPFIESATKIDLAI